MANRPSRLVIGCPSISASTGRYEGRFPLGNAPSPFAGSASGLVTAHGALSTGIRLAGSASDVVSASGTLASGGGSGTVIFNPGDLGNYASDNAIFTIDTNSYDSPASTSVLQSTVTRPGGSSKCIRIAYGADDDGTELLFPAFAATKTLYYRWYMMLGSEWSGHFPVGFKVTRTFTKNNWTAVVGEPGIDGDAYSSPKLWMRYANPDAGFNPDYPVGGVANDTKIWGTCIATMNLDIGAHFLDATLFDNGLSHVRAGVWYSYEIFQQMNSADGVGDGRLEWRIDRQPVYVNNAVRWVDSSRYAVNGIAGWQSMWFGGNCSYGGADGFTPPSFSTPFYRYEDGYLVHTQAQWL